MLVNYSDKEVIKGNNSIFLAGPTPRNANVISWRGDALNILNDLNFDGIVYVPEDEAKGWILDDDKKFLWERNALTAATVIAFWVPRKLPEMPAFSTNVEFGYWIHTGKVIYGRPDDAERKGYLDRLYKFDVKRDPINNLKKLLEESISFCNLKR